MTLCDGRAIKRKDPKMPTVYSLSDSGEELNSKVKWVIKFREKDGRM